jgi:hypothetical protein
MFGMADWDWWLNSDGGLLARVGIGSSIFVILGAIDLYRNGRKATRWREYCFLLLAVGLAMAYGAINDTVASHISWEYFFYGKGLSQQLGPGVPSDLGVVRNAAVKVGLKATWSAGLIIGVALLIANNPRRNQVRLGYRAMALLLVFILIAAAIGAGIGAIAGGRGLLAWSNPDIAAIARDDLFRPTRFMAVYGINMGGYVGGILGTACCITWMSRKRRAGLIEHN